MLHLRRLEEKQRSPQANRYTHTQPHKQTEKEWHTRTAIPLPITTRRSYHHAISTSRPPPLPLPLTRYPCIASQPPTTSQPPGRYHRKAAAVGSNSCIRADANADADSGQAREKSQETTQPTNDPPHPPQQQISKTPPSHPQSRSRFRNIKRHKEIFASFPTTPLYYLKSKA
jgi:hypothetical protein